MRFLYVFVVLLFGATFNSNAQGIEFEHNLDTAFVKAKAEGKMVFVDFYTTWCGPCKKLAADVFPLKEVGDFYNTNFINCKIQCDQDSVGIELAKKYSINAYPTLMFLGADNKLIHSMAGAPSADQFIEFGKEALSPEKNLASYISKWDAGSRDPEFVKAYFEALKERYRREKASSDFSEYFNKLSEKDKISEETFELVKLVGTAPFSPIFEYLEANRRKYYRVTDKEAFDKYISNIYLWGLKNIVMNGSPEEFEEAMAKFKAKKYPYYDEFAMFLNVFQTEKPDGRWDVDEYMRRGTAFLNKYGTNNDSYTISLTSLLGNLTGRPNQGAAGIVWMENLLARNPNPQYLHTYFYILWRNSQYDKALNVGDQIRDYLVKNNESTESIDNTMIQIRALKEKYEKRQASGTK